MRHQPPNNGASNLPLLLPYATILSLLSIDIMLNRLITWSLPAVFLGLAWRIMDTSPTLFLYNLVMPTPRFTGQTVWITGASSGIGAALVCEFARSGARHVVLSARRVEKMQQVVETCQEQLLHHSNGVTSTTFSVVPYDALQVNATETTVRQALNSAPAASIDTLVLNSGIYQLKPALETTAAERQKLSRVNLEAPIALSQALIQMDLWKQRGHGNLVVISSIMAKGPHGLCSFYAATKAALRNYFQTLSTEEFDWLTVKMILPGGTATDMWKNSLDDDTVQPNPDAMMTPERLAQLITTAVAGPWCLFWEVWISPPAGLLYVFMSHYTPALFYFTNHFIAWLRLAAFRRDAMDVIEIKALIPILVDKLKGKL